MKDRRNEGRLPVALEHSIAALCEDYPRRTRALLESAYPAETLTEYARLNAVVDDALEETCEEPIREQMRSDLARRRGAMYTQIFWISEKTYKGRKQAAKLAIARRMRWL